MYFSSKVENSLFKDYYNVNLTISFDEIDLIKKALDEYIFFDESSLKASKNDEKTFNKILKRLLKVAKLREDFSNLEDIMFDKENE